MTLQKKTFDNSVKNVSKDDHSHGEQAPFNSKQRNTGPQTRKTNASNNNKVSQKNKKLPLSCKKRNF